MLIFMGLVPCIWVHEDTPPARVPPTASNCFKVQLCVRSGKLVTRLHKTQW